METESAALIYIVRITTDKFHVLNANIPYQAEIITSDFLQKSYTLRGMGHSVEFYIKSIKKGINRPK